MTKGRIVQLIAIVLISLIILNVVPFPTHNPLNDVRYIVTELMKPP